MSRLRIVTVAGAVTLMTSLLGGLAAQDASTRAEPCPSVDPAVASPSASSIASPTATAAAVPEASPAASPAAEACTIDIQDLTFPARTEIAVGTTVTWTNSDPIAHTVTAADETFDSGILGVGKSFSHAFDEEGTFDYTCMIHPFMQGSIVVR
jgi:plastocyanin